MVGFFSAIINLLMLTGPIYMLQVYDRVLSSGSVATLVGLFAIVIVVCKRGGGSRDVVRSRSRVDDASPQLSCRQLGVWSGRTMQCRWPHLLSLVEISSRF